MNLEDIMLSKMNQSQRISFVEFHLYETPRVVKLIEIKSIMVAARGWVKGVSIS